MMIPLPNSLRSVISENSGLQRYLESLTERKDFTPRSWLYDGEDGNPFLEPDAVLQAWLDKLAALQTGSTFDQNVYHFDISQKEKWGPQGGHAPVDQLAEVYMPSFEPPDFSRSPAAFKTDAWAGAIEDTVKLLKAHGIRNLAPRSYARVVDDMRARDTLISNSGWPDFTRRSEPDVKRRAIEDAESGAWRNYPAILLFRTYNGKTRQVWMFPMSTNIVEGAWFQPLTDAIMHSALCSQFFSPWKGFEAVRDLVTESYNPLFDNVLGASDFSSTDAHFQLASTLEVYKVLKELFRPSYANALHESLVHMHRIPLIIGPNRMLIGEHGVSSGSNWTNFVETIFDLILGHYVKRRHEQDFLHGLTKLAVSPQALFGIGDDMAWFVTKKSLVRSPSDLDEYKSMLERYGLEAGQVIKAEKTMIEPDKVKSLQRLFQRGYTRPDGKLRAVYSTVRALKSSVYPERMHRANLWNSDMFCARQFMILENCADHPLFAEFVKFVCKGNHHLVPFAKSTTQYLDRVTRESKLVPGLNTTYNQEKRDSSLASFESIRVARKL